MPAARAAVEMQRDLVLKAMEGDADAFTQLMRVSAPRLLGAALLILRDRDRADDAVQEAFIAAWKSIRALRKPDAWDAWLQRLIVRKCYRIAERDRRRVEVEVTSAAAEQVVPDASADVAGRDWVVTALGRLDIDQRAVIALHYYLDLPMREVAEILGIPMGTAASRLHRGLETLRAATLDQHGTEGPHVAMERTT